MNQTIFSYIRCVAKQNLVAKRVLYFMRESYYDHYEDYFKATEVKLGERASIDTFNRLPSQAHAGFSKKYSSLTLGRHCPTFLKT